MKKLTLAVFVIVLIGLTKFAFAEPALPDLKVKLLPLSFPSTKYPPYVVTISVEVSNIGQAAAGPFTLEISLDSYTEKNGLKDRYRVFPRKFADLKPGEKTVFRQDIKIEAADGDIRCHAYIVAMEKDDWNNSDNGQSFGTIIYWNKKFVADYLRPDLEIKLTSPNSTRPLTRTVRLEAVVTNKGNAESPATEIVLRCKEKDKKTRAVPPLKPGASFRHEFQHKWYTLGSKKCTAEVNPSKAFDELNKFIGLHQVTENKAVPPSGHSRGRTKITVGNDGKKADKLGIF
jgi:hypothetical protein